MSLESVVPAVPAAGARPASSAEARTLVRGKALIFWDLKIPGKRKKLDAIDTDQITPASDCVSESLETLDERWKAGAFRYLMPDFRARVHRGETFLIAGDRFAIGSSRDEPGRPQGRGREVGLQLVGSSVARAWATSFVATRSTSAFMSCRGPEAVSNARDGDEFSFDPESRQLRNDTRGETYDPLPLPPKEDEIRRTGGIIGLGHREFTSSVARVPSIEWPDPDRARTMTATEQIVWAHRVDKEAEVTPGATLRVYADLLPASDGTAPFAIHTFNQITGGRTILPRQAAIANDHFVFTGREDDERQTSIGRAFAHLHGLEKPYYATPGDGIFHFYFPEQGLVMPGQFIPGADSHSRAYGAYGAVGMGIGSTTLGFGSATGYIYFTLPRARRVVFAGALQPWVSGKDIVLDLLRRWGAQQSQGMSVELVDANRQLPVAYRNTIANMMAEAESLNGIFAPDEMTYAWYRAKGITDLPYAGFSPGADAVYEIDETIALTEVVPMIAKPFSPGNAFAAEEVALERMTFDKALIGSCTNGSYDDLLSAALVVRAARARGISRAATEFVVFPGSGGVARQIERPDARLGGESIAEVFRSVGGQIRQSWCGPASDRDRMRRRASARSRLSTATGRTG